LGRTGPAHRHNSLEQQTSSLRLAFRPLQLHVAVAAGIYPPRRTILPLTAKTARSVATFCVTRVAHCFRRLPPVSKPPFFSTLPRPYGTLRTAAGAYRPARGQHGVTLARVDGRTSRHYTPHRHHWNTTLSGALRLAPLPVWRTNRRHATAAGDAARLFLVRRVWRRGNGVCGTGSRHFFSLLLCALVRKTRLCVRALATVLRSCSTSPHYLLAQRLLPLAAQRRRLSAKTALPRCRAAARAPCAYVTACCWWLACRSRHCSPHRQPIFS